MTEEVVGQGPLRAGSPLRTPRAAAFAGIIFSALMITALVLLRISAPAHSADAGAWLTDPQRRAAVAIALNAPRTNAHARKLRSISFTPSVNSFP